jgi:hypothetical protein
MAGERDEYLRATYRLSKVDTMAWSRFMQAFARFATEEIEKCMTAPPDSAEMAIGMARKLRDIRNDIVNIDNIPEALKR